jgi:nucleotide-binding universal stress UspA family protein
VIARVKDEVQAYLSEKAAPLRESGIDAGTEVALGDPVEEILRVAGARGADVIVMSTHGRTGLAQAVFGSVAARVVGSGVRPVLLVRPTRLR